jgi:hypothetical protein
VLETAATHAFWGAANMGTNKNHGLLVYVSLRFGQPVDTRQRAKQKLKVATLFYALWVRIRRRRPDDEFI